MKKLTGVLLIETGVVNRGDGIGNIATVKKITTHEGLKVFFSPVSYKRALWKNLQEGTWNWKKPFVTREGGVVQRTGTIIDSEEFDFAGTMVAKPKYERYSTFLADTGISINNYAGDMEFMTNMAIAKMYGSDETNIINKENFFGLYVLPFCLEIYRVGIQEIKELDTKIADNDSIEKRVEKVYKSLKLEKQINIEALIKENSRIIESVGYDSKSKITTIVLTKAERLKRIKDLLEGIGEIGRRIEGSEKNLTPFFSAFSLDYNTPKFLLYIKEELKREKILTAEGVIQFGKSEGKNITVATIFNYASVIKELVGGIEKELK